MTAVLCHEPGGNTIEAILQRWRVRGTAVTRRLDFTDIASFNSGLRQGLEMTETIAPLPQELVDALRGSPSAMAAFELLPDSHKQEYSRWIADAEKEQTRRNRSQKAVDMLLDKAGRA